MKYNKKYLFAACAALLLGMQSCDLEEYNPAGSTPDNVYKEQAGFEALVNSAYAFWGGQFYGREDFVLLLNGGGDLWINIANCGYGRQMSKYEELTAFGRRLRGADRLGRGEQNVAVRSPCAVHRA